MGDRVLLDRIVGPGTAAGHIALGGDVAGGIVGQGEIGGSPERRVIQSIHIVVIEVLAQGRVVVLSLGEIPDRIVEI